MTPVHVQTVARACAALERRLGLRSGTIALEVMIETPQSVVSADGTRIGYRWLGRGPSVVLLHGGVNASQHMMKLGRALADAIPGARLVELTDAGHFGFSETPEPFLHAVREFLARVEADSPTGEPALQTQPAR